MTMTKHLKIIGFVLLASSTLFLNSCTPETTSSADTKEAEKTDAKEPKGKQTPAPEIGKLDGEEAVAFSVGMNAITTFFPVAFYEDLMRNRISPDSEEKTGNPQAFINQFSLVRQLRGPKYKLIATPNNDTYYCQAYCDVSTEPLVFHIPEMEPDRYFIFQFWDPNGDTFEYLGSRTIGSQGGDFALVGPNYQGSVPKSLPVVKAPYENFVIWGRVGVLAGENDPDKVHAIQDQLELSFISDYLNGESVPAYSEEKSKERLSIEIPEDLPDGLEWYFKIAEALKHTAPKRQDSALLVSMEYIGYSDHGKSFNYKDLSESQISGLRTASQYAFHMMDIVAQSVGEEVNGWRWSPRSGILGNDYLFRAAWARWYTGGNSAEEAIYMDGRNDDTGAAFDTNKKYVIHFPSDQLPRVQAFWSISMYNLSDGSFTENEINRYSIGSNTQGLQYNPDGSLDIYIQRERPEEKLVSNWLPSPKDDGFYLDLRLYNPDNSLQNGTWAPPAVKFVQ